MLQCLFPKLRYFCFFFAEKVIFNVFDLHLMHTVYSISLEKSMGQMSTFFVPGRKQTRLQVLNEHCILCVLLDHIL